eukprot:g533.t1
MAAKTVWNPEQQTYHGGQEWSSLNNFVEDFSVTTNGLGAHPGGVAAAQKAMATVAHYPPADFEPARSDLCAFLYPKGNADEMKKRLLMGNGASELIDLIVRHAKEKGHTGWKPGSTVQYKEYERSSKAAGHTIMNKGNEDASLLCVINPCNPTGEFLPIERMKAYITENTTENCTVLVDESMLFWEGPEWRQNSLINQQAWIKTLLDEKNIAVWIIHSWTKIWSCCGLRVGSALAPSEADANSLLGKQPPWSLNTGALHFISAATAEVSDSFIKETWKVTPEWRANLVSLIEKDHPNWAVHGEPWLSWVWIDTKSEATATEAVEKARLAGCPIRWGKYGYAQPQFIRIAVRDPKSTAVLMEALKAVE